MKKGQKVMSCLLVTALLISLFSFAVGPAPFGVDVVSAATTTAGATQAATPKATATTTKSATPSVSSSKDRLLTLGSFGEDVKQVQTWLNNVGYNLKVDGIFGPKTLAAVKSFQSKNGLVADGVFGPKTYAKLNPPAAEVPVAEVPEVPAVPAVAAGKIVKLGLGHLTSIGKSKDLAVVDDKDVLPLGQVDTVIAAVGFDKDGKVVSVTIDNAQTKVNFDKELKLTSDVKAEYKTKVELGEEYGMIKASKIGKEWYQQIAELEKWMIGKTVAEIKAMKTKKVDDAHPSVPDIAELTSLVTVTVQDYIACVEEAYNNGITLQVPAEKVGLGTDISIAKSKGYSLVDGKETLPLAQVDTVMVAAAFDVNDKVAGTIIDNAQTKINFDKEGKVTSDKKASYKTKVELGAEYGMIKASKIGKEWFEQSAELAKWMVGKTVAEIKAMKTKKVDDAHPSVPDVPELTSLVTVTVQDYIKCVEEAHHKAK